MVGRVTIGAGRGDTMTVPAGRIAIVGATGITGGFAFDAAGEMGLHPIALGRDRARLTKFVAARGLGDDRLRVIDQTDRANLHQALSDVDAVISTVAPFRYHGLAIARAAAELGLGYTDPSGETGFIRDVIATLDPIASASGATLCTGNGAAAFLGDVAIRSIVDVERDRVGAVLYEIRNYAPTSGSLRSYLTSILPSGAARIRNGKIEIRPFADYAASVNAIPGFNSVVPDAMVVTRYWHPDSFDALGMSKTPRVIVRALAGAMTDTMLSRLMLKLPLEKLAKYKSDAEDTSVVIVHAETGPGDGTFHRCSITGHAIYPLTGRILAATIKAMTDRTPRPAGVRAASEMFASTDQAIAATGLQRTGDA